MTTPISSATQTATRWQIAQLSFETTQPTEHPFDEEFGAVFTNTDGSRLQVAGFYNGDSTWLLRFCAPNAGEWNYQTFSSLPELAGQTGKLTVSENQRGHGPVQISSENRQKFVYADGTPYFLMAFELDWLFALDADNPDDIPRTRQIVETVASSGFNQIVMNVFAYDADWGEQDAIPNGQNFARPRAFPFGGSNDAPNYDTLDVEFFQRFDRVIEHLNEKQIVSHLMIYVWNKKVNWPQAGSMADNRYFDYIVKRYGAYPNIIWNISKEAMLYGKPASYVTDRIDRLRRLDAHRRLVTVHDYQYCSEFSHKVDFISTQEWAAYLYDQMLAVKEVYPNHPILNIETGAYEKTMDYTLFNGGYSDPLIVLDRAYQCAFAGTYSNYYWQNTAWYQVVCQPFDLPPSQQPHFRYYRYLTKLFGKYPFDKLAPLRLHFAPPILSDGAGTYLFYLPPNRSGIYGVIPDLTGKTVKVRWFNPLSGEFIKGGFETIADHGRLEVYRPDGIESPTVVAILTLAV